MATSLMIEEERGTFSGSYRMHNGYYAGDFSCRANPAVEGSGLEQLLPQVDTSPTMEGRIGQSVLMKV